MALTFSVTPTSGSNVLASDMETIFKEARDYINGNIVDNDIGLSSIETTDIVKGEYDPITGDHQFTCGDVYQSSIPKGPSYRVHSSVHYKQHIDKTVNVWQRIPKTGKRIYLELPSRVIYRAFVAFRSPGNNTISKGDSGSQLTDGHNGQDVVRLAYDDQKRTEMQTFFAELSLKRSELFLTDSGGVKFDKLRSMQFTFISPVLTEGWHTIYLEGNLVNDICFIQAGTISIEVIPYTNGGGGGGSEDPPAGE